MRPLCVCGQRPAAINYKKTTKLFIERSVRYVLSTEVLVTVYLSGSKLDMKRKTLVKSVGIQVNTKNNLMCFI